MTTLALRLEISPGSTVEAAAADLVTAAGRFNMAVTATFNGVPLRATPTDDPADVVARYDWIVAAESAHREARR